MPLLATLLAALSACASPSSPAASTKLDGAPGETVPYTVTAGVFLKVLQADAAHARAAPQPCRFGSVQVRGRPWEMTGGDRVYVRRFVGSDAGTEVAFLFPVVEIKAALEASKAHRSPPAPHFLLLTAKGSVDTFHRLYDRQPSDAQLVADLDEALGASDGVFTSYDLARNTFVISGGPPTR